VHAITVARTHLQRPAQAGGRSGPMPNKTQRSSRPATGCSFCRPGGS